MAQRAVLRRDLARLYLCNLGANIQQSCDKSVNFGLGFAFGWLDHQCARHGPAHCRRMKAVINQPFGNIIHADTTICKNPRVQNTLVRHPPFVAHEQNRIGPIQARGNVIGVQNRHPCGLGKPRPAHHQAIGPRNQQNRRRPIRRSRNRAACRPLCRITRIARQIWGQMRLHPNRPHARPPAAMRNGKGFMQVQMANIAANFARFHQPHQRIHICAVQIHLPPKVMGNTANLAHGFFKHPMRAGIGDHAGRQPIARRRRLLRKIDQIHIAIGRRFYHHHLHPRHLRRCRVCAMRRHRNKANLAPILAPRAVIGGNRQKPRIFALRARIGLHGKGIIARDLAQLCRQILNRRRIALHLIGGGKGMNGRKFWPCDWHHFRRRIQLHRAAAQRDHRTVKRQIAVRQTPHIAHHFRFCAVHMKYRMRQIGRAS